MSAHKNTIVVAFIFLLGIVLSVLYYNSPVHDFGNYYFGSRFVLEGKPVSEIYEPYRFNEMIRAVPGMAREKFLENYAVVPPFTLIFYIPFSLFELHNSKFLFNLVSVMLFCFFLLRLLRHLKTDSPMIYLLPLIFLTPFRNNLLFGQTYLLLMALLMAGFLAEEKKQNTAAAVLYALSIALKFSPAALLIYLFVRKNARLGLLTVLFSGIFFFSAAIFTSWNFMMHYVFDFIPRMSVNEINNPYATSYQSLTVLLRNLFIPDLLLNPSAWFDSAWIFSALSGLFAGILFFFFLSGIARSAERFSAFGMTLLFIVLFPAYTSNYSLVFLLPVVVSALQKSNRKNSIVLILVFLIANIPVSDFQSFPLLFRFPRLYLLLILFFMLCPDQRWRRRDFMLLGCSATFFIAASFFSSAKAKDPSRYFFDKEVALLCSGFEFRGKEILVRFTDETGSHEKSFPLRDSVYAATPLELKNGQVFYGQQLTFGSDQKLKPVLVNRKEVVYLGDRNRGIGFYTLRKIVPGNSAGTGK